MQRQKSGITRPIIDWTMEIMQEQKAGNNSVEGTRKRSMSDKGEQALGGAYMHTNNCSAYERQNKTNSSVCVLLKHM